MATIEWRTRCTAKVVETWSIDAPPRWEEMDEEEREDWLEENQPLAEFVQERAEDEEDRTFIGLLDS
jgi:hypothetical protein